MSGWANSDSHIVPVARLIASLAAGLILAAIGGMVLGEYTFQGEGIQWLSISGGVGLGAVIAWVLNRVWAHNPPLWMCAVAAPLALAGEALAVQRDMDGYAWPPEGWVAVLLAGAAAAYGIYSANKVATQEQAKKA